ncbi:hypothetical protein [Streptomyces fulvoviolaceus]|uniref:hypothetical protein n=1 Tax=Streptomyces fulvoviolaceus TaxID=285535 RepID=UPI00131D3EEC|nr:hypothetical protein [Streptomyces fulvoviolaceus]MCT9074988.1 hypothetical protein [Streptomyces fulvoviolaceus]
MAGEVQRSRARERLPRVPGSRSDDAQVELAGDEAATFKTAVFLAVSEKCSPGSDGGIAGG